MCSFIKCGFCQISEDFCKYVLFDGVQKGTKKGLSVVVPLSKYTQFRFPLPAILKILR